MKAFTALTCCALSGLLASSASAQKNNNKLLPPPANIKVDGDLKDWGDSLRYYNEDKKLFYSLANDQENIYMAIRFNDRTEEMRILRAGLTLSINPKGKKKGEYSITFPVGGDAGEGPGMWGQRPSDGDEKPTQEDRDELMRARLTKLRSIKVAGFSDIESDIITTSNTYGIKVALDYDKDGYLVYEAAIPLKFFHADISDKKEWAFNFKINGITRPSGNREGMSGGGGMRSGGMGRGGMGGGGMRGGGMGRGGMRGGGMRGGMQGGEAGTDRSELSKSVDFWEKFYLNK